MKSVHRSSRVVIKGYLSAPHDRSVATQLLLGIVAVFALMLYSGLRYPASLSQCGLLSFLATAFFSPNGSLAINGGAPAVGRSAITEAAQSFMTAFPDLEVTMGDLLFQGQKVIYKWTLSGSNTGPGGTGQRVRISGFEEWQLGSDGLVAESQGHFESAD